MSQPAKGVLEIDCNITPVPAVGAAFDFKNGAKTVHATVVRVGKLKQPVHRQMGVVNMLATHMVEFVVANP